MNWVPGLVIGKYPGSSPYLEMDLGAELTNIADTITAYDVTADDGLTISDISLITGSKSGMANAGVLFKVAGGVLDTVYEVTVTIATTTKAEDIVRKFKINCGLADGEQRMESCA